MAELPPRVWPDQEIHDELKLDQESFKSCAWGQKDVNAAPSIRARWRAVQTCMSDHTLMAPIDETLRTFMAKKGYYLMPA